MTHRWTQTGLVGEPMQIGLRVMDPHEFAAQCTLIVKTLERHAAHRALDLLTNDVLSSLGYSEGIRIFEAAVVGWHDDAQAYPSPETRGRAA